MRPTWIPFRDRMVATVISPPAPRRTVESLVWLMVLVSIAAWMVPGAFFRKTSFPVDGHAYISLNQAVDAAYCHAPGKLSSSNNLADTLVHNRALLTRSIPEILASHAGSLQQYCASVDLPFLNNENSLMLLMRGSLAAWPNATPFDVSRALSGVQLAMVLLFGFAMLSAGCGLPLTLLALLLIFDVHREMRNFQYTIYAFFVPDLLMAAACYILAWRFRIRRWWFVPASCVVAGFLSAFWVNMRSSHLPVYTAFFVLYAIVTSIGSSWKHRTLWLACAGVCFVIGYGGFLRVFISPLIPPPGVPYDNHSYHVIAHPLVLSLALPPNALSQREGIRWNDEVGLELARRMIPDAVYLGPKYEEALFLYYLKLWMLYPGDMLDVYRAKIALAGAGIFTVQDGRDGSARTARWLGRLVPLRNGVHILTLFGLACLLAAWRFMRSRSGQALLFLFISLAALGLLIEAIIIMPEFQLQYAAYLRVYAGIAVVWILQVAIDVIVPTLAPRTAAPVHPS